jgi:hypothetical protein
MPTIVRGRARTRGCLPSIRGLAFEDRAGAPISLGPVLRGGTPPGQESTTMHTITEWPADSAGAISPDPAIQQRERKNALHELARLKKEARDEIDRLIQFLEAAIPT